MTKFIASSVEFSFKKTEKCYYLSKQFIKRMLFKNYGYLLKIEILIIEISYTYIMRVAVYSVFKFKLKLLS